MKEKYFKYPPTAHQIQCNFEFTWNRSEINKLEDSFINKIIKIKFYRLATESSDSVASLK